MARLAPVVAVKRSACTPYNSNLPEARQAMPFDPGLWKQWEGHRVDSGFPLERCIGGSSRGAVFETQFQGRPAAIKLLPGTPASIAALLTLWEKAAGVSHPALVRILARGETLLGDLRCAYIVMERADENLAEVLTDRFLTPTETRDLLFPLLGALQYLEGKGFAHGGLKPANILAFGDQVKLSSDGLVAGGDPAEDCRAIGVLLEEALGAGRNQPLPEPFAGIARNCLMPDPAVRWNRARIEACLRGDPAPAGLAKSRARSGILAATTVILASLAIWYSQNERWMKYMWLKNMWIKNVMMNALAPEPPSISLPPEKTAPIPPAGYVQPPANARTPLAVKQVQTRGKEPSLSPSVGDGRPSMERQTATVEGITQVLPEIPQAARNTINGRVRINVRVSVDGAGNVILAKLEPPAASPYFTDRVLAAVQAWKFPAGNVPQDWSLRFELMRRQTLVSAAKIAN